MITLFRQVERFEVQRYRQLRDRTWAWITVGHYNAASMKEARQMARDALADKLCVLRAVRVGSEALAPEGVHL